VNVLLALCGLILSVQVAFLDRRLSALEKLKAIA